MTAPAHYMLRTMVTRYTHGVPTEVACECGGCEPHPQLTGTGRTLAECATDLKAKFAKHSEGSR